MSDKIIDTIATALAYRDGSAVVLWKHRDQTNTILAVLKAQHIAVVELPEPEWSQIWNIPPCGEFNEPKSAGDSVTSVEITDKGIKVNTLGELTAEEARMLAAALLAAADAAEKVEQ